MPSKHRLSPKHRTPARRALRARLPMLESLECRRLLALSPIGTEQLVNSLVHERTGHFGRIRAWP